MSNLIEQLGGYEKVNKAVKKMDIRSDRYKRLKAALLNYRRQHNIFEIGDKVTLSKWANDFSRSHNGIYEILSFENDLETLALLSQDIRSSTQHIKHATDAEIKAGHRLPQLEVLNDIDIPPNTIILGDK